MDRIAPPPPPSSPNNMGRMEDEEIDTSFNGINFNDSNDMLALPPAPEYLDPELFAVILSSYSDLPITVTSLFPYRIDIKMKINQADRYCCSIYPITTELIFALDPVTKLPLFNPPALPATMEGLQRIEQKLRERLNPQD